MPRNVSRPLLLACALLACLSVLCGVANAGSTVDWLQGSSDSVADEGAGAGGGSAPSATDAKTAEAAQGDGDDKEDGQLEMEDLIAARDTADQSAADDAVLLSSKGSSGKTATSADTSPKNKSSDTSSAASSEPSSSEDGGVEDDNLDRLHGSAILLHGGLTQGGVSADSTAVLAGLGTSAEGLVFCQLRENNKAKTQMLASPGSAARDNKAYFHGGYKVWDGGDDFNDVDQLSVFDGGESKWECAGDGCVSNGATNLGKEGSGTASPTSPGRRDEHVAVITPRAVSLPGGTKKGGGKKQRAMIIFGGRDEQDVRLDSMYALGLEDKVWRKIDYKAPALKKSTKVEQGPFAMPAVIKHAHANGQPFPLARSGATAAGLYKLNAM
jgi:hypothetical protein